MDDDLQSFRDRHEALLVEIQHLPFITRDISLQQSGVEKAETFLAYCGAIKRRLVEEEREDAANLVLAAERSVKALKLEIEMYIALKQSDPDKAWGLLINAQIAARDAMCAHRVFSNMKDIYNHLSELENVLFPPQVFMSNGFIVKSAECSICKADYEACWHVVGIPYWGELCHRQITSAEVTHIAIVTNPANRHCRVTHFSDAGGKRNRMTWLVEPNTDGFVTGPEPEKLMKADAVLYSPGDLDEISEPLLQSLCGPATSQGPD